MFCLCFVFSLSAGCCCCLVLLYLRLYCSIIHRTGETIWHFAAFVSRLLLLFLLNTFTTSDTTSMSATLTFNRISVKSVKRKREAVLGCECFEWRLFVGGLLVNNPWKVVLDEFSFMQILFLTRWNLLPSKYLVCSVKVTAVVLTDDASHLLEKLQSYSIFVSKRTLKICDSTANVWVLVHYSQNE